MKRPKIQITAPEALAEAILTALFFWLFTAKVEPRNDPPLIVGMLSWGIAHALVSGTKSVIAAVGRFVARRSALR